MINPTFTLTWLHEKMDQIFMHAIDDCINTKSIDEKAAKVDAYASALDLLGYNGENDAADALWDAIESIPNDIV